MGVHVHRKVVLAFLLAAAAIATPGAVYGKPVSIRTSDVLLNPAEPHETRAGSLRFLSGLALNSSAQGFGGFSGLHISPSGTSLLAISDMGYWLEADLVHGKDGALGGLRNARLSPMLGTNGKAISGKRLGDAEGLAVSGKSVLVSFERKHRVWRYPQTEDMSSAIPEPVSAPADLSSVRSNKGLESIAVLPGGRLMLLTEETLDEKGHIRGWLGNGKGGFSALRIRRDPPFAVTDAALLPGGTGLIILERRFSHLGGLGIKLRQFTLEEIEPAALLTGRNIAEFGPGQTIDNFEGMATRTDKNGHTIVYLLSDDNFNGFQRTLLLQFRLEESRASARP